jgi:formylmethanofuran dehydrogenase subunit E
MKKRWACFVIALIVISANRGYSATAGEQSHAKRQFPDLFYELPPIKIIDNSMLMLGNSEDPLITLSLVDLIYYHGHMCSGLAVGYRASREACRLLFENQIPVRGEVRIVSSVNSCPADIFAHVFGVREHYGNQRGFNTLITPDNCDQKNDMKFVFQRVSREKGQLRPLKSIQIELIPKTIPDEFYSLRSKVKANQATDSDQLRFKQISQETYTKILRADIGDIFVIRELSNYQFPEVVPCNSK